MKKIGFLGGSFDPIHFGHIHLGLCLQEAHGLDEVIICPAAKSPLKECLLQAPKHRLEMAKLAVAEIPSWRVLDWEIKKDSPSYTIDTIHYLLKEVFDGEEVQLHLLIGEDLLDDLTRWKEFESVVQLAPPLIACRKHLKGHDHQGLLSKINAKITPANVLEISATEIRKRLKKRLYCGHLLPAKVLDYITIHQLY